MPEPLPDAIADLLRELVADANDDTEPSLLESAVVVATEALRAMKDGKLAASSPTIDRKIRFARRELKDLLVEAVGEDEDEEPDEKDEIVGDEDDDEGDEGEDDEEEKPKR